MQVPQLQWFILIFPEKPAKTGAFIAVHPDVPKAVSSLERPMPPCSETRNALIQWKIDVNPWKNGILMVV